MTTENFPTDWEVDKYFDDTEPEGQWELRRNFLVQNKDRYPEDYLVALSRVFTNIEFMGCSYGKEVMKRVAELSEGVVEDYREAKRTKLQRTFVKASDAAESKFSGNRESHAKTIGATQYETINVDEQTSNADNLIQKVRSQPGIKGQLIIIKPEKGDWDWVTISSSICLLNRSTREQEKLELKLEKEVKSELETKYSMVIGDEVMCDCIAPNDKEARKMLGVKAMDIFRESTFIIQKKWPLTAGQVIPRSEEELEKEDSTKLQSDNRGMKLLKLMGWSGKGIGKNEDGREDIVEANGQVIKRSGLGFQGSSSVFDKKMKTKLRETLREFKANNISPTEQLIFAADFGNEERAFLHQIARQFGLRSKSYGQGAKRQLVVTKQVDQWSLVHDLLESGGQSDLYTIEIPAKFQS